MALVYEERIKEHILDLCGGSFWVYYTCMNGRNRIDYCLSVECPESVKTIEEAKEWATKHFEEEASWFSREIVDGFYLNKF